MARLTAVPSSPQGEMDLETDDQRAARAKDEAAERRRQHELRQALFDALDAATIAMGGPKVVAGRLDTMWADEGEGGVSESRYKAALERKNYNAPRIEWLIELALHPDVAEVLLRIADGKKKIEPAEELENVYVVAEDFLAPKQIAKLRQLARTRKARR